MNNTYRAIGVLGELVTNHTRCRHCDGIFTVLSEVEPVPGWANGWRHIECPSHNCLDHKELV